MLPFIDVLLTIIHTALTLFNLVGWIWKKSRKIHLASILVTLMSWILIGLWVGSVGYCPLTDWHWEIKRELGEKVGGSFNRYMLDWIFNYNFDSELVDWITGVGLVSVIFASIFYNYRDRKNRG